MNNLKTRHYKVRSNLRYALPQCIVRDCFVPRNDKLVSVFDPLQVPSRLGISQF
jgi:hypothetical protein